MKLTYVNTLEEEVSVLEEWFDKEQDRVLYKHDLDKVGDKIMFYLDTLDEYRLKAERLLDCVNALDDALQEEEDKRESIPE